MFNTSYDGGTQTFLHPCCIQISLSTLEVAMEALKLFFVTLNNVSKFFFPSCPDDRMNYGVFLDEMTSILLLDTLLKRGELVAGAR